MKVKNDLLGYKNLKIIQDTDYFCFSLDSVLLANFVKVKKNEKNILDIGTGNAPIPLILSTKTKEKIYGIEIQKEIFEMAVETVKFNKLEDRISLINDDVNNLNRYFDKNSFDIIVCNPPYFKIDGNSKVNEITTKAIARHEIKLKLDNLLEIAYSFLKNNGKFYLVHRTERMPEILEKMRQHKIEPKRINIIFPKIGKKSNFFLVEGIKNANSGLKELNYIIGHNNEGTYTEQVKKYFSN